MITHLVTDTYLSGFPVCQDLELLLYCLPFGGYIGNPIKMTFSEKLRGYEQCSPRR